MSRLSEVAQRQQALARKRLDARLGKISPEAFTPPPLGWLKALRQALGMTTRQFAHRMGVSQVTVTEIESSEAAGSIKLSTLRRAAAALNCKVVYAIVPNQSLDDMVRLRVKEKSADLFDMVTRTMALENQSVENADSLILHSEALAAQTNMRELWNEK